MRGLNGDSSMLCTLSFECVKVIDMRNTNAFETQILQISESCVWHAAGDEAAIWPPPFCCFAHVILTCRVIY